MMKSFADAGWQETHAGSDFIPVVLSGDALSYSYAREFARQYGAVTDVFATADIKYTSTSKFVNYAIEPNLDQEPVMMSMLRQFASQTPIGDKPRLLLAGASDWNVRTLSRNKDELERLGYIVPYIEYETLDDITQKDRFYARCSKLGVPFPKTIIVPFTDDYTLPYGESDDLKIVCKEQLDVNSLQYPLIAKPSNSADWHYAYIPDKYKVYKVRDAAELTVILERIGMSSYSHALLLQEMLSESDTALRTITTFSDADGIVDVGVLGHVAIQDRSSTGIGNPLTIYGDGRDHDGLLKHAARLIKDIGYEGYANFDVMYGNDGKPRFLEVNARPGRNTYYVSLAGCPFVRPIVEHYVHHKETQDALRDREIVADKEFLFTMVPRYVAAKEITGDLRAAVLNMYATDAWQNPLMNPSDCLTQRFWGLVNFEHMKTKFA